MVNLENLDVSKKRLLFVVNNLGYFLSHRLPIALHAFSAGYKVLVVYGELGKASIRDVRLRNIKLYHVPIQRGGTNPLRDLQSVFFLYRLFCRLRPSLVHLITIKPVVYGGIAARLARIPAVVSAMAGLGFIFVSQTELKTSLLRFLIRPMFRWALGHPNQIQIFQNLNDRDRVLEMTRTSLLQTQLISGSGVDLATFHPLPDPGNPPVVVMVSRLLRDKGVREFVAAARILRERCTSARFWLIGEPDLANPASVFPEEIKRWEAEGIVEFLGHRSDIPSLYGQAHIVALPSYGEGLPKALLEAAACGRAVVTTDVPGCRDAIEPHVTGLLVPARDAEALADAIEKLIGNSFLRQAMGRAGRALAEREFGVDKVVASHLQIYQKLLISCAS